MGVLDRTVAAAVPHLPRPLVGVVARRYIAGETIDSALATTRRLNDHGMSTTLDVLGENVRDPAEAQRTVDLYLAVLDRIRSERLDANISVKLTHLGLKLDVERCFRNVLRLVDAAAKQGSFVRIDMEDSSTTSDTLDIYSRVRETHENVGAVLQSYMRRSESDARRLADVGARVRVCKGIYAEPPDVAFQDGGEINRSFLRLVDLLLERGCHVAIATHDESLVEGSYGLLRKHGGAEGRYEFQMLLGVAERLRDAIVAAGHPLRVYVPFGDEWYSYSVRRLKENPKIAGHVLRAFLGFR